MTENITLIFEKDSLIVSLFGELDHHSAIPTRMKIDEALFLYRPKSIVIDIGNVDFMDSSGLGLIMGRYTKAHELGANLIIRNPSARAKKMIALAGLEKMIQIKESEEA